MWPSESGGRFGGAVAMTDCVPPCPLPPATKLSQFGILSENATQTVQSLFSTDFPLADKILQKT